MKAERAALERAVMELEAVIPRLLAKEGLRPVNSPGSVNTPMVSAHRVAISAGRSKPRDAFLAHIRDHGYTLNALARELAVSPATLHAHRKPKGEPNSRPCPQSRADTVKALTGWPADRAHWPAGLT